MNDKPLLERDYEIGFAKINLALHVRSRRADGYHILDTIFAFLDGGDYVSAEISDRLSLDISGPFAGGLSVGADNLVLQAGNLLKQHFGITSGAKLHLDKNLPIASGIGGGSADAAAAARLLNRIWNINAADDVLAEVLAPLGADVPACIFSVMQKGQGIGTALSPIGNNGLDENFVLLVNPNVALPTGPVFQAWDGQDQGGLSGVTLTEIVTSGRNDLQKPAIQQCPEIADVLDALYRYAPRLARMSGSGATCFALFSDAGTCQQAFEGIKSQHPNWWAMTGNLR